MRPSLIGSFFSALVFVGFGCSSDKPTSNPGFQENVGGTSGVGGSSGSSGASGTGGTAGSGGASGASGSSGSGGASGSSGSAGNSGSSGTSGTSGASGTSGTSGGGSGGAAGSGGSGGAAGSAGASGSAGSAGTPSYICDPTSTFSNEVTLDSLSTPEAELLNAITPDELDIVWQVFSGTGSSVFIASRASNSDAFGAPTQVLAPPSGFSSEEGAVTLSADGLRLIFVSQNGKSFGEIVRATRSDPFDAPPTTTAFAQINTQFSDSPAKVSHPVVSADDKTLYFIFGNPELQPSVRRITRPLASAAWDNNTPITAGVLGGSGASGVVPTGLSSDGNTIFLWGPTTQLSSAAYLDNSGVFSSFVELGNRKHVIPVSDCTRIYFSTQTSANKFDLASGN